MGKLKFTLSNIWLWSALAGVSILTENLQYLSSNMKGGLDLSSFFILTFIGIVSLFMFFFINHKENKMTFDYVLIPAFALAFAFVVAGIWAQSDNSTIGSGAEAVQVVLTTAEKVKATIGAFMFLLFTYALLFMFQRTQPHSKYTVFPLYCAIIFVYVTVIFSLITERTEYLSIFSDGQIKYDINIASFFGNKNYYGGILFVGILCCMLVNYHRPRFIWYMTSLFFLLILLSTAAVLPALIAVVALPIYYIEEIVRYSVKRKWLTSLSVTLTLLTLFSLIIVFYIGKVKEWKGFNGIDIYITEIIYNKNFSTLTGRTDIWKMVIPTCFDNLIHTLFGHGFMISEKFILNLTAARFGTGVRSVHNGYLEILFEFGVLGLLANLILMMYFVYSLVRLLIEKRFHFVFVYGFVALCCAAYNMGESSPFFGYGIKEMFLTMVVVAPVMARNKFLFRDKPIKEVMAMPHKSGQLDPIKLGKGLSVIIVSLLISIVPLLLVQFTYDHKGIIEVLGWVAFYLGIALLFIPYIVSLYYRNTEKSHFVLHCVLNGVGLALLLFIVCFPLIYSKNFEAAKIVAAAITVIYLMTNALAYSFIKRGSPIEWLKITFVGGFVNSLTGLLSTFIIGSGIFLVLQNLNCISWFTYLFGAYVNAIIFYASIYLIPFLGGRDLIYEYNKISLYHNICCAVKDETTYG